MQCASELISYHVGVLDGGKGPVEGPSWPRGMPAEGRRPGASVGSGFCDLSLGPMHSWVLEAQASVQPRPGASQGEPLEMQQAPPLLRPCQPPLPAAWPPHLACIPS